MRNRLIALALVLPAALAPLGWWYHVSDPHYHLAEARRAIARGDWGTTERELSWLEDTSYPDHARLARGELLLTRKQYTEAIAELARVDGPEDLRVQALALTGRCQLERGDPGGAITTFRLLLKRRPDSIDAVRGLAAAHFDLGAFGGAIEHARRWAELDPADGRPYRLIGAIQQDLGDFDEAAVAYRRALDRQLKAFVKEEVRLDLSESLIKLGRCAEALQVLHEARPPDGLEAHARTLEAECQRQLGNTDEAERGVAAALRADPEYAPALRLRGQLALGKGDGAGAIAPLQKAARLAPEKYETHYTLALAYQRAGRAKEAAAESAHAVRIRADMEALTKITRELIQSPGRGDLHRRAAELYRRLDMPAMADRSLRAAAAVGEAPATPAD